MAKDINSIDLGALQSDFVAKKKASAAADRAAIRALDAQEAAKKAFEAARDKLAAATRAVTM